MTEESNHIEAAISDLEAWRDQIDTAIQTLQHLRSQGAALPSTPPVGGRISSNGEMSHDTFFQMTVPDAAEKYLKMMKSTKPNAEVADSLLKGGLKSSSQNFAEMVRSVLSRDSRFVKVNTEWGLVEWYPGMRRGTRNATKEMPAKSKPSAAVIKKPKGEHKSQGFSPESMKGRTLSLLNSKPSELLSTAQVTETLGEKNKPSVAAALSGLLADHLIARPQKGQYQALKKHVTV